MILYRPLTKAVCSPRLRRAWAISRRAMMRTSFRWKRSANDFVRLKSALANAAIPGPYLKTAKSSETIPRFWKIISPFFTIPVLINLSSNINFPMSSLARSMTGSIAAKAREGSIREQASRTARTASDCAWLPVPALHPRVSRLSRDLLSSRAGPPSGPTLSHAFPSA